MPWFEPPLARNPYFESEHFGTASLRHWAFACVRAHRRRRRFLIIGGTFRIELWQASIHQYDLGQKRRDAGGMLKSMHHKFSLQGQSRDSASG